MFGVVGGMHALQVLNILIMSIRARRLTLRSEGSNMIQTLVSKRMIPSRFVRRNSSQPTSRTAGPFAYIWINVFSRKGVFGVESEHFSTVFAVREVLEASSQTYQAYRASNLLPRAGMNALILQNSGQFASLRALHKWKHVIAIVLFVLWGVIILLLHGLAAQRAANYEVIGCRAVTRPWFSNGKEPCSSLVYDCHARNTTSPDDSSFDKLDHVTLATLAIAHCPELKMPPDFQRFENLMMFHLYNSTIVNWDAESSVSATAHTRLLSVLVGRTQMAEFPAGLLQPLPASLMSVQFSETNLAKLPDDLYVRWHAMAMISFENGILTEIPYQMFFSPVYTLSLMGNQIETLPTLAMMPPGMIIPELRLTHNPLRELPAALMAPDPFIMSLNVQNTSLTTMPTWVKTNTKVVWAYDTPFCATPMADPALAYQVMCFARPPGQEAFFPMYLFDVLYRIENTT
ncbi:Leucine-rich repeat domain, L domain-like [Phytophthora cactorum]|nr:Leucine-rich repeat domain, L domain-like [Phytophthora cactorum]